MQVGEIFADMPDFLYRIVSLFQSIIDSGCAGDAVEGLERFLHEQFGEIGEDDGEFAHPDAHVEYVQPHGCVRNTTQAA